MREQTYDFTGWEKLQTIPSGVPCNGHDPAVIINPYMDAKLMTNKPNASLGAGAHVALCAECGKMLNFDEAYYYANLCENHAQQDAEPIMTNKPENPPAFPVPETKIGNSLVQTCSQGMTLRDYFAAAALAQTQFSLDSKFRGDERERFIADLSKAVYEIADAMLTERSKP